MSAFTTSATNLATVVTDNAGGASARDLKIAGAVAGFALIFMLIGGLGHRAKRVPVLGWFERFSEKVSGMPAWASLSCGLAIVSLITALFGMYWDVALHIDRGRDPGVFSNPSHIFILAGLYGIFASGFFAICLGREERADRPGPTAIRISRDWYAPLGGILMCTTGLFALIGFPLDDFWHRLFGQDVTLWGPTHLMLIGGASMTLLGIAVIQAEVVRAMNVAGVAHKELAWVRHLRVVWLPGGLLVGMSTFQGEFDYGVPQFQLIYQPMLIMLAAGVTLVAARMWLGRTGLFGAVIFFIITRAMLDLIVHGALGESLSHFPLYIVEALCVEAAVMLVSTKRPLRFGLVSGALIGTVGLAAEWGWSHVWMPIPWPATILPQTIGLGLAMALCASLLGAWIGARLSADELPYASMRRVALPAALAIFVMIAFPLFTKTTTGITGKVVLTNVQSGPKRTVMATVTLSPRNAADHANWLTATDWQGGGQLVTDRLERISEGVYRTTQPISVYGKWKAMIRLHKGRSLAALPIYAPEDLAIPVAGIAAPASFERAFVSDHHLLQREAKTRNPYITWGAYGTVFFFTILLMIMLAWGLHRFGTTAGRERDETADPVATDEADGGASATAPVAPSEWAQPADDQQRETTGAPR